MKVWEKINRMKGTNATMEQMLNWACVNRIYPEDLAEELELAEEWPQVLNEILLATADTNYNEWVTTFLSSEIPQPECPLLDLIEGANQ